jgi:hypothetical protein
MSGPTPSLGKTEAGQVLNRERIRRGITWARIAEEIGRPPVWTVAALLGKHPVPPDAARTVGRLLELDAEVVAALQLQPTRIADRAAASDPTIYRQLPVRGLAWLGSERAAGRLLPDDQPEVLVSGELLSHRHVQPAPCRLAFASSERNPITSGTTIGSGEGDCSGGPSDRTTETS